MIRAGTLTFFHNYLKEAVQQRYLPQPEDQRNAHRRLGEFFEPLPVEERILRELPWQWQQAEEWSRLAGLLADLDFFSKIWRSSEYELKSYWTTVEAHSDLRTADAYRSVFETPEEHLAVVLEISNLMQDTGQIREAIALREFLVDNYRATGKKDMLVGALNNLAILLQEQGDRKAAILLQQEAEMLSLEGVASTHDQIATANNKAAFLHDKGNVNGALEIWKHLADFCRKNDRTDELPKILNNIGMVQEIPGKMAGSPGELPGM